MEKSGDIRPSHRQVQVQQRLHADVDDDGDQRPRADAQRQVRAGQVRGARQGFIGYGEELIRDAPESRPRESLLDALLEALQRLDDAGSLEATIHLRAVSLRGRAHFNPPAMPIPIARAPRPSRTRYSGSANLNQSS